MTLTRHDLLAPATARQPAGSADPVVWQLLGACRNGGGAAFFHPDHERGAARAARAAAAKHICAGCPVLEQCREHALAAREPYCTWGGLSEVERRILFAMTPRPVLLSAGAEPRGR